MSNPPTNYNSIFPSFIAKNGIARTNRFVVNVAPPANLGINAFSSIPIESAEFPALGISTTDFKYDQSPSFSVPYERNPSGQAVINFVLDEKHSARDAIEYWMENIIFVPTNMNQIFGYSKNYYKDIVGSIQIFQLGLNGTVTYGLQLFNAFPIGIDNIQLNWGDENNYARLSVTFAYFDSSRLVI